MIEYEEEGEKENSIWSFLSFSLQKYTKAKEEEKGEETSILCFLLKSVPVLICYSEIVSVWFKAVCVCAGEYLQW